MLDRSQPYDQVYGMPGVSWAQGGRLFDFSGHPVDGGEAHVVREPAPVARGDGFETMHWKHLKAMLDQYGQPYTNRAEAVAFLRGGRAPVMAAEAPDEMPPVIVDRTDLAPFRGVSTALEPEAHDDR